MDKEHILAEIRRTAEENDGQPLGRARFAEATGIREADWSGRFWARWGDAVREAGYEPNSLQRRYSDEEALTKLVPLVRRLRRMPTHAELRMERRSDQSFPSAGVFERLGRRRELAQRLADHCRDDASDADVLVIAEALVDELPKPGAAEPHAAGDAEGEAQSPGDSGYVYLLKAGRHYKIGRTTDLGRRSYDLAIQLPEPATRVHVISTDDPVGIERYWHQRFADRHKNGEWFELTREDVAAFKRRKFM